MFWETQWERWWGALGYVEVVDSVMSWQFSFCCKHVQQCTLPYMVYHMQSSPSTKKHFSASDWCWLNFNVRTGLQPLMPRGLSAYLSGSNGDTTVFTKAVESRYKVALIVDLERAWRKWLYWTLEYFWVCLQVILYGCEHFMHFFSDWMQLN